MVKFAKVSLKYGTKLLVVKSRQHQWSQPTHLQFRIERVKQYKYINENWDNSQKIWCGFEKTRSVFVNMNSFL